NRLYDADAEPRPHLLGARRSHAAGDLVAARLRRGLGDGARRAVRHEPAGDLEAPQGAGARGPDRARAKGAVAPLPARSGAAEGGDGLAALLPELLERQPRRARDVPRRERAAGDAARPEMTGRRFSAARA